MVYLEPGNLRAAEFQNSMWKKFDLEKNRLKKIRLKIDRNQKKKIQNTWQVLNIEWHQTHLRSEQPNSETNSFEWVHVRVVIVLKEH